jgi:hypothetical protein
MKFKFVIDGRVKAKDKEQAELILVTLLRHTQKVIDHYHVEVEKEE